MWKAFVFGAFAAGVIGPIALLIFGTAARQGFAAGAFAGLGAALADFLYALGAFSIGALVLPLIARSAEAIQIAGGLTLVGLGTFLALRQANGDAAPAELYRAGNALWPTFLLAVVNPVTIVVFAGIAPQLPVAGSIVNATLFALALAIGSATVQLVIAGFGAALGRALPGAGWRRAIATAAALGILVFGVYGLVRAFQALI